MNASQLINQTSGVVEYYTPSEIIEAAREAMGSIELDPASSANANEIVKAQRYFNQEQDGLKQTWYASTVWVNWPFGRRLNDLWVNKILEQYRISGEQQIICICYACTSEKWFRPLLAYPQCYLHGRTNYRLPSGEVLRGVTKGSVVTYLGANIDRFARIFEKLGTIKVKYVSL